MGKKVKNILVTGSNGFIGSHLIKNLVEHNYDVVACDISDMKEKSFLNDFPSKETIKKIKFLKCDIKDFNSVEKIFHDIDFVFHLAAKLFIPQSWKEPGAFYHTNVIGTANILEACRINNCKILFNSSYAYGEPDYLPIDETHPLKSSNPYGLSKLLAEQICKLYKENYGLKVTIFRPFNVYGPGQDEIFLIPEIIKQALSDDKKIIKINDLKPKRDYLYIDDLIDALLMSIEGKDDIYNVGGGYSLSVEDIIKIIIQHSGGQKKYLSRNIRRDHEIDNVVADISKIQKEFNWRPKITFEEGIKKYIYHFLNKQGIL